MNTMYRNQEGGYQQVRKAFEYPGEDILQPEDITDRMNLSERISKGIDADAESNAQETFSGMAEAVGNATWSSERRLEIDKDYDGFHNMPKALLHVHSTVGLSVEGLGKLIEDWNNKKSEGSGLRICYADVPEGENKVIANVLLYQVQAEKLIAEKK